MEAVRRLRDVMIAFSICALYICVGRPAAVPRHPQAALHEGARCLLELNQTGTA